MSFGSRQITLCDPMRQVTLRSSKTNFW